MQILLFGHKTGLGLLEQVVAELDWATRLFTKTKNLAHSLEEWATFGNSFKFSKKNFYFIFCNYLVLYFYHFNLIISSLIFSFNSLMLKFLIEILTFKISNVCSIWFSSSEYGGIVNTTHFNFFIITLTFYVLWILALSYITIIIFS